MTFIVNYAEENSILLPVCIPGYKSCEMKLLPSSKSKKSSIWRFYDIASKEREDIHVIAYTAFCGLWKSLLPDIIMMRPMSDCWQYQQNSSLIVRWANCTDIEKSKNLEKVLDHLQTAAAERSLYRKVVDDCSGSL